MIQRSLYYWSKLYEEQLVEGDRYDKLCRMVCINILDFKYLKNDRFHNGYRLKEIETNEELTDIQEIHFIEIPKLKKLEKAEDELYRLSRNSKEREIYYMREKSLKDEISALANAEEEGIEKGIEKGREEEKINIAKNMIENGLDDTMISSITGLSIEKIKSLR